MVLIKVSFTMDRAESAVHGTAIQLTHVLTYVLVWCLLYFPAQNRVVLNVKIRPTVSPIGAGKKRTSYVNI